MNTSDTIIFIAVILGLPWLFILVRIFIINRNIIKNFKSLTNKYGFEVDSTRKSGFFRYPVSHGQYRGIPVEICSFVKEDKGKKSPATFISVDCINPDELDFIIVKKDNANNITYGGKAFNINDTEFDSKFIVSTNNMKKMFDLLNFSIKYKLLQLVNVGYKGELQLNGTKLRYEEKELVKGSMNLLRIEILLHLLCEIADELKHAKS